MISWDPWDDDVSGFHLGKGHKGSNPPPPHAHTYTTTTHIFPQIDRMTEVST